MASTSVDSPILKYVHLLIIALKLCLALSRLRISSPLLSSSLFSFGVTAKSMLKLHHTDCIIFVNFVLSWYFCFEARDAGHGMDFADMT